MAREAKEADSQFVSFQMKIEAVDRWRKLLKEDFNMKLGEGLGFVFEQMITDPEAIKVIKKGFKQRQIEKLQRELESLQDQ